MPPVWRTVRVFISSTFRDMHAERDHLVRFVFPRLREQLLPRRIHLVDVDLRWGVTGEQDASEVCREVLEECRPHFLCMLGGRYGTIPEGKTLSITADEVHCAMLGAANREMYALIYFRHGAVTESMDKSRPSLFREPRRSENAAKLAQLKRELRRAGHHPYLYRPRWNVNENCLVDLRAFGERVARDIGASIDNEFGPQTPESLNGFAQEENATRSFIAEVTSLFVLGSRETVLRELLDHVASDDGGYVCVTGAPGSGKSALLAHLSQQPALADSSVLFLCHFIGVSPGSTDLRLMLRHLCHELKAGCPDITAGVPNDTEELRVAFGEFLRQASARRHVVILIDAIDQLDYVPFGMHWLPEELPAGVRIILSALNGPGLEELRRRPHKQREIQLQPLTALDGEAIIERFRQRYRKLLDARQQAALLAKTDAGKPLYLLAALEELRTLGRYEEITQRIAALPPLIPGLFAWILQRLQEDEGFRNVAGEKVGRELVSRCCALLGASRYGLSQRELNDLLDSGDPQGNVAALLYLLRPYLMHRGELLDFYHGQFRAAAEARWLASAAERQAAHSELAVYFDGQPSFLESLKEQRDRSVRFPLTARPVNRRKVEELVYQRGRVLRACPAGAADFSRACEAMEGLLSDPCLLEAKVEAGLAYELASDLSAAVAALPQERSQRQVLRLLEDALLRHVRFVENHPTTLFQCVWNSCWLAKPPVEMSRFLLGWRRQSRRRGLGGTWVRSLRTPPFPSLTGHQGIFRGHRDEVLDVQFSPTGGMLASSSKDGTVRIWEAASGLEVKCLERQAMVHRIAFSPSGQFLASASTDGSIVIHSMTDFRFFGRWDCQDFPLALSFLTDQELVTCAKGSVWRLNVDTRNLQPAFTLAASKIDSVAFHAAAGKCAFALEDGTVGLLNLNGEPIGKGTNAGSRVWRMAFATGTEYVVLAADDHSFRMVDTNRFAEVARVHAHLDDGTWRVVDKDGKYLGMIGIKTPLRRPNEGSIALAVDAQARSVACAGADGIIQIWQPWTGKLIARIRCHDGTVAALCFSPDGKLLASASCDGTAGIWKVSDLGQVPSAEDHADTITAIEFCAHDRRVVSASFDGGVRFYNSGTGRLVQQRRHRNAVRALTVSNDSELVATSGDDGAICIWRASTGQLQQRCQGHESTVNGLSFSARADLLASVSVDRSVAVWRVEDLALVVRLSLPDGGDAPWCVSLSSDEQYLAAGTMYGRLYVWRCGHWGARTSCGGADAWLTMVDFSPDGTKVAATDMGGSIHIWNPADGSHLRVARGHGGPVCDLHFSFDGKYVITESTDNTVRVWDAASALCVRTIDGGRHPRGLAGRNSLRWTARVAEAHETRFDEIPSAGSVAILPQMLGKATANRFGSVWAGVGDRNIYIVRIERSAWQASIALQQLMEREHDLTAAGDGAGLQACLAAQADILFQQGDRMAALDVLKRQEEICVKLGFKRELLACLKRQLSITRTRNTREDSRG